MKYAGCLSCHACEDLHLQAVQWVQPILQELTAAARSDTFPDETQFA